jgi:hypothetical protein
MVSPRPVTHLHSLLIERALNKPSCLLDARQDNPCSGSRTSNTITSESNMRDPINVHRDSTLICTTFCPVPPIQFDLPCHSHLSIRPGRMDSSVEYPECVAPSPKIWLITNATGVKIGICTVTRRFKKSQACLSFTVLNRSSSRPAYSLIFHT